MSSAAEAETCGTFNNGKTATNIRPDLITLEHEQPATPLKNGQFYDRRILNSGMKSKRSKAWHMKWHWFIEK